MNIRIFMAVAVAGALLDVGAASATIVTTFDGSQGWMPTDVRTGGTAGIVDLTGAGGNLENNQPAGPSAVRLTTDSTNAAKAEVGIAGNFGKVSDILNSNFGLSYSWYDTGGGAAAPSIKLAFKNYDPTYVGDSYGQLIYEPYWQSATGDTSITPTTGDWVTASIDFTNGRFWNSGMFGIGSSAGGPPNKTLSEWLASFDSGFGNATLVGISVGLGTYNPSETGYFDSVSISGTSADNSWNFESPAPVPLPAGLPLLLGALGGFAVLRRRKQRVTA